MDSLFIFYFAVVGLSSGALLAFTGVLGPFLIPLLILLGLPSAVARGTDLVSEIVMTIACVFFHKKVGNLDRRIILAYLPGALTVVFGASISVEFPEAAAKVAMGIFEMLIGIVMIMSAIGVRMRRNARNINTKTITRSTIAKLALISLFAGFSKGFFGAGWGPLGVGLSVVLGIEPQMVVGSSLAIRLLLDITGGATYVSMNSVDYYVVLVLISTGIIAVPFATKLTTKISQKTLRVFLGVVIMLLGLLLALGL